LPFFIQLESTVLNGLKIFFSKKLMRTSANRPI
jgi:hypothetical protein